MNEEPRIKKPEQRSKSKNVGIKQLIPVNGNIESGTRSRAKKPEKEARQAGTRSRDNKSEQESQITKLDQKC